jgi:hypothetical protein
MKSLFKIAWAMVAAVVLFACTEDEAGNLAQLKAFGPNPALRGSEMTFVGENLNQVVAVIFPENITVDNFTKVDNGRIKVTIPQDAQPGIIELLLAGGGKLVVKGELSFTEPITITGIAPSPVKKGQTLTIEGDYLNLIQKVVFAEKVEVKCQHFTTWTREKIELVLPAEAQTGAITLTDTSENPFELKSETTLQVVLPSVNGGALTLTGKKPGEQISAAGENLDLVVTVEMPDGASVDFETPDNTLTFTLPENISDGEVVMIPASGVRVAVRNIEVAVPGELVATPSTGLKADDEITVSGTNMELVTSVAFAGVEDAVTPTDITPTGIKVTFPAGAQSGDLTLNTASGKTASVEIETLKPEVTTYNPNPVSAGESVEIHGLNLNLVASVTFGGGKKVDATAASATSLTVKVPTDAETGEVTLTMANGETVTGASLTVDKPTVAYIPVMPEGEITGGGLWQVEIANESMLTGVELKEIAVQYVLSGNKLYIGIPGSAHGNSALKLISSNGDISYTINIKAGGTVEEEIWSGALELPSGWGTSLEMDRSAFDNVNVGSYLRIYLTHAGSNGQLQLKNNNWTTITEGIVSQYFDSSWSGINVPDEVTSIEIKFTAELLNTIGTNYASWDSPVGLIIGGQNLIISKVTIVTKAKASEVIHAGPTSVGSWGATQIGADKFANAAVGNVIHVKTSNLEADAQGSFKNGGTWGEIASGTDYFDITGDFELEITSEILEILKANGLIVSGQNYTIEEVSIISEI